MESKIKDYIKLKNHPVAIIQSDTCPEGATQFKEGKWGCVVAMLNAASKGRVAALSAATTMCIGGKAGLGFEKYPFGWIEYFLSTGSEKVDRFELYKKDPELAKDFITKGPNAMIEKLPPRKKYLLFMPLEQVTEQQGKPECVAFLVNADQLSGLVTLVNFDHSPLDATKLLFGAGCAQAILYPMVDREHCYVGLTDPSARKCIHKDLLSFSTSYERFMEMEANADGSFLTTEAWNIISKRI